MENYGARVELIRNYKFSRAEREEKKIRFCLKNSKN